MPDGSIVKDGSEGARLALREFLSRDDVPAAQLLEDELSASAFANQCEREWAKERQEIVRMEAEISRQREIETKQDFAEVVVTEVLEVATSATAGALSTWRTDGGVAVGAGLNVLVGGLGKIGSCINPTSRPLRVASKASKVLLHSQISIITRKLIGENS